MKYILWIEGQGYVEQLTWFAGSLPIVLATTEDKQYAEIFNDKQGECWIVDKYPKANFIPIRYFKP